MSGKGVDVRAFNRGAWDKQVAGGNKWSLPVDSETIERARKGEWSVVLTPSKPVPRDWFGDLTSARVLGLASAGGQQCPTLAAAGASVTVFDNSPAQLEQDRGVAKANELVMEFAEGDMSDLGRYADGAFDLIFHPVSNCFVEDVRQVWQEAFRVLRPGGTLLAGICNPLMYLFDDAKLRAGELVVRHTLPYSDLTSISEEERREQFGADDPLSFGHTLEDQLGGQTDAGFHIVGFYEDNWGGEEPLLDRYTASFIATRSLKPLTS